MKMSTQLSPPMAKFLADVVEAGEKGFAGKPKRMATANGVVKRGFVFRTQQQIYHPTEAGRKAHREIKESELTHRYPESRKPRGSAAESGTRAGRQRRKIEVSFAEDTHSFLDQLAGKRAKSHVLEDLVRAEATRRGLVGQTPT